MRIRRAIVEPDVFDAIYAGGTLPKSAATYLIGVLRLDEGTEIDIGDGAGHIARGRLRRAGRHWSVESVSLHEAPETAPGGQIVLWCGLLKPDRFRLVIEKAVELGVTAVQPVISTHSAVRPPDAKLEGLVARWQRIARDTTKQCLRLRASTILPPRTLDELTRDLADCNRILATFSGVPVGALALSSTQPTVVAIGPEGGFHDSEQAILTNLGFQGLSLGAFPLRAETAAIASVTLLREALNLSFSEGATQCP